MTKENDDQLKTIMIIKQILHVSTLGNLGRKGGEDGYWY